MTIDPFNTKEKSSIYEDRKYFKFIVCALVISVIAIVLATMNYFQKYDCQCRTYGNHKQRISYRPPMI